MTGSNPGDSIKNSLLQEVNGYASDMKIFKSTEQTGTAGAQAIAHGLPVAPTFYIIVPSKVNTAGDTFVVNSVDATNVNVTVSNGSKYFVIAW